MNEIMKHPVRMPQIIRIDMSTDLALKLYRLLEAHSKQYCYRPMESSLAKHVAHKFWILWYQAKCWRGQPDRVSFTCLTNAWLSFCKDFVEKMLNEQPNNQDLKDILQCLNSGRTVQSGESSDQSKTLRP